jgi:hypothetical protein
VFITLHPFSWWSLARFEDGIFMASFRPRFRKEMIWGVKSKPAPAFPSRVDDCVPGWFLLLTGVDEARKLTLWMKANIGPREAICVKYVLNTRKSSHGLLVWKRRRRRKRPGSAALRGLRSTLLHYSIPIFLFSFLFKASYSFCPSETIGANTSAKITPATLSYSSVAALP